MDGPKLTQDEHFGVHLDITQTSQQMRGEHKLTGDESGASETANPTGGGTRAIGHETSQQARGEHSPAEQRV